MSSFLPEGVILRAATEDDGPAAADVYRAAEIAVRGWSPLQRDDMSAFWRDADLPTGTWLIFDGERLVAVGTLFVRGEAPNFIGAVDPDELGRGLGSALLDLAEARTREAGLRRLRVDAYTEDTRATSLLTSRGHRDVRHFFVMRIDVGSAPPSPEWPPDLRGETFREEDARAVHATFQEAFANEWGSVPLDFDEWRRLRIEVEEFDPGLWFVARDGDEVVGAARCEYFLGGGWVSSLGVRANWRRRGLGLALLREAFGEFHRRGERIVRLGVDTQNRTGATRLYERAGMRVELEDAVYEKALG
jgi:mycothiol synthase